MISLFRPSKLKFNYILLSVFMMPMLLLSNVRFHGLLLFLGVLLFFTGFSFDTFAQNSSDQHIINGNDIVYSQFIPLYGTFSVSMDYAIPVAIHIPDTIHAGDSFDVLITANTPGKITTTFLQDENVLGIFEDELKLGEEKTIEIPETWVGQVFAMPNIHITPAVTGPATVTPESVLFDSETTKQFQVFVDDDIGMSDSVRLDLDITIKMQNGGNINLGIAKIPIGEHTSDIQSKQITKQISLEKIIPTNLHMQVKQGELPEHVKVKSMITDDLQIPIEISTYSVEVYVDGVPHVSMQPNVWSDDIFVGSGTHNFQARFSETRDPENIAITYTGSDSAIQTITVMSGNSSSAQILCQQGMVLKEGQCVKEDNTPMLGIGGCLIATAAYGSELAPQVQTLREVRDNTLMSTVSGTAFMTGFNQLYYSFSPTIADMERDNPLFKDAVRAIITPMIFTLSVMGLAEEGSEFQVVGLGISVIALNLGMYVAIPAVVGFAISKHIKSRKQIQKF